MIRIFSILSIIAALMSLASGAGIYWLSQSDVNQAQNKATSSLVQGLASSISNQINTLQHTVSKMAKTPEVIEATYQEDPSQIKITSTMLEKFMPYVMKIRILPANTTDLDESETPHMGNADLIMAQDTLLKPQLAVIQGQGSNRHLAITSVIVKNDRPIGVILASLEYNFLQSLLNSSYLENCGIELRQLNFSLARSNSYLGKSDTDIQLIIPKTSWQLHYSLSNTESIFSYTMIGSFVLIPVFLVCIAFFIAYRKITHLLRQDQGTILKAVKDLLSGKTVGSYPVHLVEMKSLISTMIQFKRVLDNGGTNFPSTLSTEEEIDVFLNNPDDTNFLDMEPDTFSEGSSITMPSSPISLPDTPSLDFPDLSTVTSTIPDTDTPKKKNKVNPSIYKAYDIRGIADKTLTSEIIYDIGRAIASIVKEKNIQTIVLGRDGRLSSPALAESLAKGIISTGINILDIGLVPSPLVYFVAQHTEGKSAIVVTASHNPAEYNGLKIIIDGESLAGDKIQQLKHRVEEEQYITSTKAGSIDENNIFINEYIGMVAENVHLASPIKIVVDCGNGAAGQIAPTLLKTLGCEVIELFCDIDGNFPNHHPDPSDPENLKSLMVAVIEHQADLGLAFDGDGDRLGVIDSKGKIIWPDRLLMLFAKEVLHNMPGAEIIYDVKSSHHLKDFITQLGGRPTMWRTGHSFIKAKLKETGAALAGEMSGHIFFNDRWFGFDDALYSAARLIAIVSEDTRNSAEIFTEIPETVSTPEIYIKLSEGENTLLMDKILLNASFQGAEIITIDGIRVNFVDGWGLIRASNTIPALALRFEADNTEALARIQSQFKQLLTQIKADMKIPF